MLYELYFVLSTYILAVIQWNYYDKDFKNINFIEFRWNKKHVRPINMFFILKFIQNKNKIHLLNWIYRLECYSYKDTEDQDTAVSVVLILTISNKWTAISTVCTRLSSHLFCCSALELWCSGYLRKCSIGIDCFYWIWLYLVASSQVPNLHHE